MAHGHDFEQPAHHTQVDGQTRDPLHTLHGQHDLLFSSYGTTNHIRIDMINNITECPL